MTHGVKEDIHVCTCITELLYTVILTHSDASRENKLKETKQSPALQPTLRNTRVHLSVDTVVLGDLQQLATHQFTCPALTDILITTHTDGRPHHVHLWQHELRQKRTFDTFVCFNDP